MILEAENNRLKREHNDRAWMVWHSEALARQKKMAKLSDMMFDAPTKRSQTPQEIEAITRSWLASRRRKSRT